ncbi:uncharacterized protein LOC135370640 isoform X2 [Ornithodoros turicata]|uniref:uncharacterized protein LOC135370640 isoform X2 n=1 Tax=Ornithodoros turicata TaxID=34597 RepID=UPI0031392062
MTPHPKKTEKTAINMEALRSVSPELMSQADKTRSPKKRRSKKGARSCSSPVSPDLLTPISFEHSTSPLDPSRPQGRSAANPTTGSSWRRVSLILAAVLLIAVVASIVCVLVYREYMRRIALSTKKQIPCTSEGCIKATAAYERMIDTSFAPCREFYNYSCGGWQSRARDKPKDWSYADEINVDVRSFAHTDLYMRQVGDKEVDPFYGIVTFYRSCYDFRRETDDWSKLAIRSVEALELSPVQWLREDLESEFFAYMVRLSLEKGIPTIYDFSVALPQPDTPTTVPGVKGYRIVQLDAGPSLIQLLSPKTARRDIGADDPELKKYIRATLTSLGDETAQGFVVAVEKFEAAFHSLSRIAVGEETRVTDFDILPTIPNKLATGDWKNAIEKTLPGRQRTLVSTANLATVANATSLFFGAKLEVRVYYVCISAMTNMLRFHVQLHEKSGEEHQAKCIALVMKYFTSDAISLLSLKHVTPNLRANLLAFVDAIRQRMLDNLHRETWMNPSSVGLARGFLQSLKVVVPDTGTPIVRADVATMTRDFLKNYVSMTQQWKTSANMFPKLIGWILLNQLLPSVIVPPRREAKVVITNAIMWEPWFYNQERDEYINYATLGARVAAELYYAILHRITLRSEDMSYANLLICIQGQVKQLYPTLDNAQTVGAYGASRALALVLDMVSPLPDEQAQKLFFGRFCQQFCVVQSVVRRIGTMDIDPQELCEFAVYQQQLSSSTFHCEETVGRKQCEIANATQ